MTDSAGATEPGLRVLHATGSGPASEAALKRWRATLAESGPAAAEQLKKLLAVFPQDGPARFFLDRCERFMRETAVEADPGVVRMDAK